MTGERKEKCYLKVRYVDDNNECALFMKTLPVDLTGKQTTVPASNQNFKPIGSFSLI